MSLFIRALSIAVVFVAPSAFAEVPHPRVVQFAPAALPSIHEGMAKLSPAERSYAEKLPLQLSEPMRRIEKTKYKAKKRKS